MNRFSPTVLLLAGLCVAAVVGGGATLLEVDNPLVQSRPTGEQPVGTEAAGEPATMPDLEVSTSTDRIGGARARLLLVSAALHNPGESTVTGTVALRVDHDGDGDHEVTAGKRTVTIPAGDRVTVDFTVDGARFGPGTYEYVIESGSGNPVWARDRLAFRPAAFALQLESNRTAVRGESVSFDVSVTNVGDFADTSPVALAVDRNRDGVFDAAETVEPRAVTLGADEGRTVTFSVPTDALAPGRYRVEATTANRSREATLVVRQPATFRVVTVEEPREAVEGEPFNLTVTVTNAGDVAGTQSVAVTGFGGNAHHARNVTLAAGETGTMTVTVRTTGLSAGYYTYQVSTPTRSVSFPARLLEPARFHLETLNATGSAVRGEPVTVTATVTNVGEVAGSRTVAYAGPTGADNRTVVLDAGETTTVAFTLETASLDRGNYTYAVSTDADRAEATLRVRAARFEVAYLGGGGTYLLGEPLTVTAEIRNTGDAPATRSVELKLDLDDDDRPESHGITAPVTLAPGETTTVAFTSTDAPWDDAVSPSALVGSHIFGVYTGADNETDVFAVKQPETGDGGGPSGTTDRASLDEISQEKYGYFYSALSNETKAQVDEIYRRQPFADGLVVTEVLTREQIARREFGLETSRGDPFDFAALDVQVQQEIEAMFDAQFQSDVGDRVESWDELARSKYGEPYAALTPEQQESIRAAYRDQFSEND